ncbi:DUF5058 family protein [Fusibacter ferrireducens]|uniref:DUF5058 family protein n=1 Tax=Fusibacter ferrireducens TaxID=2785058 RepID=A0ABR9ZV00_9FIRM|nr:DUF5058 family protein [Fusibacter ferrireducens]MBF4694289.1 DUF5058 family protein [Fusibacter ferrireducens]
MSTISENKMLYLLVILGICYVLGVAIIFLKKSWDRAKNLGFTKTDLSNVIKASVSFSLVPSIAIVVGFFSLATMLGVPWPWFRLSVVGSVGYEIMAADMSLKATGHELANATSMDFILIMYVMSLCILGGLIAAILFSKKIQMGTMTMKQKDSRWGALGNSTFMLTIIIVFLVPMLMGGGVNLLTFFTSLGIAVILSMLVKKFKMLWLNNFILALSLLGAMISSVLWTQLLG